MKYERRRGSIAKMRSENKRQRAEYRRGEKYTVAGPREYMPQRKQEKIPQQNHKIEKGIEARRNEGEERKTRHKTNDKDKETEKEEERDRQQKKGRGRECGAKPGWETE